MASILPWTLLLGVLHGARAEFGLAGQLFQLRGASSVNNAKLAWATVSGASSYVVEQSVGNGQYQSLGTVPGTTYDSYGLAMGSTYNFRVTAMQGTSKVDTSSITSLAPYAPQGSYSTYDNTKVSAYREKSELVADGVYYQYVYETNTDGSFNRFVEQTSSNGYDFTGDKTVLDSKTLCAPAATSCKLERILFRKNPATGAFVMWAHYERAKDYALGYVAVAHKLPGDAALTFDGAYQPNKEDSRDMTFFADGADAWLVTSTKTNTDNNIYRLTPSWTAVASFLVKVNAGGHREAPSVVKANGWYYLFTSRAAGWLPSQPQYIAAQSMSGPWSSPVNVGNTATFGGQSDVVHALPSKQYLMNADRWSNNWPTKGGSNRQIMLPLSVSDAGSFTTYHFYRTVQYSDEVSTTGQGIYGVQTGKIVSVGKPSSCSAGNTNIAAANDGIQSDPSNVFVPSAVPFSYQIDLQEPYAVSQVDLTTKLVQGSETFYQYILSGSTDGTTFTTLADQTKAVDVGFSVTFPSSSTKYRYIKISVSAVVNDINGNVANWAVGINEMTVYGN